MTKVENRYFDCIEMFMVVLRVSTYWGELVEQALYITLASLQRVLLWTIKLYEYEPGYSTEKKFLQECFELNTVRQNTAPNLARPLDPTTPLA